MSQNTFYEVYKLCSKFHAFIKKCTIVLLCCPTISEHALYHDHECGYTACMISDLQMYRTAKILKS